MPNTKTVSACECYQRSTYNGGGIEFCPLHKAAPALLEAAQAFLRATNLYGMAFPGEMRPEMDALLAAIRQATGEV